MFRIWLLAAGLVLGVTLSLEARDEKSATVAEHHDDVSVKLTERQIEAGNSRSPRCAAAC